MNVAEFLKAPTEEIYNELPPITLDVETTNLDKGSALNPHNRLVSLTTKEGDTITTWTEKDGLAALETKLLSLEKDVVLVGHNIKFDLQWLAIYGLSLYDVVVWDTMVVEKVLLGNNPRMLPLDLGSVAKRYGMAGKEPLVDLWMKSGVCPSTIPTSMLLKRNVYDVKVTEAIYKKQLKQCNEDGKLGVALTRCLLTPVLADIESHGMKLDKDRVMEEYDKAMEQQAIVTNGLLEVANINWNSPKQVGELLYDKLKFKELKRHGKPLRTPAGGRMTGVDTIKLLKCTTKRQKNVKNLLLRNSAINAKLTKSLNAFKRCVDADDILHFAFRQHITATHRLSSVGTFYKLQGQNIPRKFKRLFTTKEKDWDIVEGDGSNLEFRVAGELGDDDQVREDISNPDFDAHQTTADTLTRAGQETSRQDAKSHTFKPLYGGTSGTDAEVEYYKQFNARYSGVSETQERWKREALETKKVRLPWGMEFFFPHTKITRSGYQEYSTQICNYPVQSFATADIIPIALVYTWHMLREYKLRSVIVNTVHDSIILESPKDETDKLNEILLVAFTKSCYNYIKRVYKMTFKTPLGVGIKRGSHWSEGDEIKTDIENTYE